MVIIHYKLFKALTPNGLSSLVSCDTNCCKCSMDYTLIDILFHRIDFCYLLVAV